MFKGEISSNCDWEKTLTEKYVLGLYLKLDRYVPVHKTSIKIAFSPKRSIHMRAFVILCGLNSVFSFSVYLVRPRGLKPSITHPVDKIRSFE